MRVFGIAQAAGVLCRQTVNLPSGCANAFRNKLKTSLIAGISVSTSQRILVQCGGDAVRTAGRKKGLINRIRIASVAILFALLAAREAPAGVCVPPPGRATLVSVHATARARISDRTGQTCGSTGNCTDEKELVAPGSISVDVDNVAGPDAAHATVTIAVSSAGGGVQRIDISGSASSQPSTGQASVFDARAKLQVVDGPVRATFIESTRVVRNGVIESQVNTTQSFDFSPGNFIEEITDWGAFSTFAASTSSNNSLAIVIEPLPTATATSSAIRWINPSGGSYVVGSNWDPAQVPNCSSTATFDLNTGLSIPVNAAAATAGQWQFSNGTYALTGPAEVFGLESDSTSLKVTNGAHMRWTGGTLTAAETVQIGLTAGTISFLDVVNAGTSLQNDGVMIIDNGFLDVNSGGRVSTEFLSIGAFGLGSSRLRVSGVSFGTPSSLQTNQDLTVTGNNGFAGELTVLDGAFIQADDVAILEGTAQVKGSSTPNNPSDTASFAALSSDGPLTVGSGGSALLTIEKGGAAQGRTVFVDAAGTGTGRIVVDGQGEFAVLNALDNLGIVATEQVEVEVKNGGVLQSQAVVVGSFAVRPGAANLTIRGRTNSLQQSSRLRVFDVPAALGTAGITSVGGVAEGQLNILEGASASLEGGLTVGEFAQGVVVVSSTGTGDHSTLSVTGKTVVGEGANGFLTLHSATMTNMGDLRIGVFNNLIASTLTAEAFSILNIQGALEVGVTGRGTLNLSGSQATCNTLIVGGIPPSIGRVNVRDVSELTVSGNAQVGVSNAYGEITIDEFSSLHINGTMTIGGPSGGFGVTGTGKVIVNGTLDGGGTLVVVTNGRLEGNGTVSVPKVDAGGYIAPGLSPGTLTIDGDLEILPEGVLAIEYEGLNPGDFDTLHVTGDTTLNGRLEVHFRGGFSPNDPAAFIQSEDFIETDGDIVGDYAERIYAFPDLFADFDDDGDKDLEDVADFQNCFGVSGGGLQPGCDRADWEDNGVLNEVEVRELAVRLTGPK